MMTRYGEYEQLLQSDLDLDDREIGAIAHFAQPEVMRRVRMATK